MAMEQRVGSMIRPDWEADFRMTLPFEMGNNLASSSMNDFLMRGYANEMLMRDRDKYNLEKAMMEAQLAQARQPMSGSQRGAPGGTSRSQMGAPRQGSGQSWWEQEQMGRQKADRDYKQQRSQKLQDKRDDMSFLKEIMSSYGGGRGNKQEGYTEQIFNNAGAPQVVKLKNSSTQDSSGDILKLLLGKYA